jgi:hypothetical protein
MTLHNKIALLDFNISNDSILSSLNSSGLFTIQNLTEAQVALLEKVFEKGLYLIQNNEKENEIGKSLFNLLFPNSTLSNVYLKVKQKASELILEPALMLLKNQLITDDSKIDNNLEIVLVESAIY